MRSLRCFCSFSARSARRWLHSSSVDGHVPAIKASGAQQQHVPVLIVGAGPVGLTLSILLSKLGVRSLVIDRMAKLSQHPQAHFINNRTMEIFRKMDGLAEEIMALQPPLEHWRRFVYCTTLSGPVLGTVDHLHPSDIGHPRSPELVAHFSQHRLVPLLYHRVTRQSHALGNKESPSGVLLGHEFVSFEPINGGIVATVKPVESNPVDSMYFRADYLVAADGAGSSIRRLMGLTMEGVEDMQHLISVHFLSKELGQHLVHSEPGMLYFVFNSNVIAVVVAHDLEAGEFVIQIPIFPPQQSLQDFSPNVCKNIIRSAAGISNLPVEVLAVRQWTMHAQVAEKFVSSNAHVFLVGDAAHRFPPAGGFGMNTGIQDVHNLAWKLCLTLNGSAPPNLLHTYELERRPIALANTALSVANFKAAMAIPSALGLNPASARVVHTVLNNATGSWLSRNVQSTIMDGLLAIGRSQVSPFFLNKYNPLASARLAQVKKILEEGRSLQLQFPAEDLGFRYTEGAIVVETTGDNLATHKEPSGRREEYVPSTLPGSRLPHMDIWVTESDAATASKKRLSTLDLVSIDQVEFVLFVAPNETGCNWACAGLSIAPTLGVVLKTVFIGPAGFSRPHLQAKLQQSKESDTGHFPDHHASVLYAEETSEPWWQLCGIPDSGAILVRPDNHIAWRSKGEATPSPAHVLQQVFAKVIGRNPFEENYRTAAV